jgi:hypothetical protein
LGKGKTSDLTNGFAELPVSSNRNGSAGGHFPRAQAAMFWARRGAATK